MDDLYIIHGAPPEIACAVEDKFLKRLDQDATDALDRLLLEDFETIGSDVRIRSGWSRFIMSLLQRNPEKVAWLRNVWAKKYPEELASKYAVYRRDTDPPTYEEYKKSMLPGAVELGVASLLQAVMDMPNFGAKLNSMMWSVVTFANPKHALLTSDRPVIITNGLLRDDAHVVVPIGPRKMFVAVAEEGTLKAMKSLSPEDLMWRVNDRICTQAKAYVYGDSDRQLKFVENRLGRGAPQFIAFDPDRDL